jgi:hypothetical protein
MRDMNQQRPSDERIVVRADPDIADLIPGFLENRRRDVDKMREALTQGEYETIRVLGHSMKGAAGGHSGRRRAFRQP